MIWQIHLLGLSAALPAQDIIRGWYMCSHRAGGGSRAAGVCVWGGRGGQPCWCRSQRNHSEVWRERAEPGGAVVSSLGAGGLTAELQLRSKKDVSDSLMKTFSPLWRHKAECLFLFLDDWIHIGASHFVAALHNAIKTQTVTAPSSSTVLIQDAYLETNKIHSRTNIIWGGSAAMHDISLCSVNRWKNNHHLPKAAVLVYMHSNKICTCNKSKLGHSWIDFIM